MSSGYAVRLSGFQSAFFVLLQFTDFESCPPASFSPLIFLGFTLCFTFLSSFFSLSFFKISLSLSLQRLLLLKPQTGWSKLIQSKIMKLLGSLFSFN